MAWHACIRSAGGSAGHVDISLGQLGDHGLPGHAVDRECEDVREPVVRIARQSQARHCRRKFAAQQVDEQATASRFRCSLRFHMLERRGRSNRSGDVGEAARYEKRGTLYREGFITEREEPIEALITPLKSAISQCRRLHEAAGSTANTFSFGKLSFKISAHPVM